MNTASSVIPKTGNVRWAIVVMLILDYIIMFMGRTAMSMSGPALMKQFGWNATEFGWISTAFFIGYAITMMPAGALADRFGGGRVLVIGTIWWCIFTFLTPYGTTLGLMMLIRILVGIGQGVIVPSDFSLVAKWVPKKESGKATGFVQLGCPTGIALTMVIAAWIIQNWGWQTVYYSFAFLGPIWCLIWWMFGKDKPEQHRLISKEELEYIRSDQDSQQTVDQNTSLTKKDIFSKASVWLCAMSYFCANYLFFLFMTWLPTYFAMGRGINLKQSAIYSMLPYLVAIPAYPLGGYIADFASKKFGENIGRKVAPIGGLILAGILLIFGSSAADLRTAVTLISASNGFLCLTMGSYFSIPMVFSRKDTGIIVGLNGVCGTIAGILAPVITGLIIDVTGKYENALYLGATVAVIGAILILAAKIRQIESKASSWGNLN